MRSRPALPIKTTRRKITIWVVLRRDILHKSGRTDNVLMRPKSDVIPDSGLSFLNLKVNLIRLIAYIVEAAEVDSGILIFGAV